MDIPALLHRFLSLPAATLPSYAADGRLYFLNDAAGSAQVWELPPGGGEARPRTTHRDAVSFVAGSPVDGSAVFGRDNAGDERLQLYALGESGEARALTGEPATMFGWGAFAPDGKRVAVTANNRNVAHADPLAIDLATGAQTRLAEVEGPHALHCWHPDGTSVVVGAAPRTFESDLFEAGARTARLTPHTGDWRHHTLRWQPGGKAFWLLTDRGREHLGVAIMEPGGEPRFLYAPDFDVEKLEAAPDGATLAVVVNENGYSRLRLLDAATGAVVAEPAHPPGAITKVTWHPGGQSVAFDLVCVTRPSTIWTADRIATTPVVATLAFAASPAPEGAVDYTTVSFPTFDRQDLPSYLALPPGEAPSGGRPALVWVHGGPESQSLPNWRPDLQLFLALGFAVMIPNVRGSTGYGRTYAALDDREKRPDAVRDVAAAHAWLAAQPGIDGKRIAVMGQSYGGWMTLAAVTRFPDLWAAGVDFYGIARWKTFFEKTGPWRVGHRAAEYGDPVRDAALLESLSPLNDADKIMCPMLVAQGMTDPRVPPHESEQIVDALRGRNVPVEYVRFDDEGHGFLKRDNRRVAYERVAAFLSEHLRAPREGQPA